MHLPPRVARELLLAFFTAFGVLVGGSVIGALASFFTHGSPMATMNELAKSLKLWAVMVGIGGTSNIIRGIESGLFAGELLTFLRQMCIFVCGFMGAYFAYWLVISFTGGE